MVVTVESSPTAMQLLDMVIQNVGQRPAFNTRIRIDPTPKRSDESGFPIADMKALREPIAVIPPGHRMARSFDSAIERKGSGLPDTYTAHVQYADSTGPAWDETYTLDLMAREGALHVDEHGIHHATEALRGIETVLKKSSVLKQHGAHVETSTITESRHDWEERKAGERTSAAEHHQRLIQALQAATDGSEAEG